MKRRQLSSYPAQAPQQYLSASLLRPPSFMVSSRSLLWLSGAAVVWIWLQIIWPQV